MLTLALHQPTSHDIKLKNEAFAQKAREGKPILKPSRREKLEKSSPVSMTTLAIICFVIIGGGTLIPCAPRLKLSLMFLPS
jgi:hypothetical protein